MDYSLLQTSIKKERHPIKGLAYILLGMGAVLHSVEFVGGIVFLNKVKSGELKEVIADLQQAERDIKTNKDAARYVADKTISEINEFKEYLAVGGFKLAALAYRANN